MWKSLEGFPKNSAAMAYVYIVNELTSGNDQLDIFDSMDPKSDSMAGLGSTSISTLRCRKCFCHRAHTYAFISSNYVYVFLCVYVCMTYTKCAYLMLSCYFITSSYITAATSEGDNKTIVPWSASEKLFKLTVDDDLELLRQVIADGADVNSSSDHVRPDVLPSNIHLLLTIFFNFTGL